MVERDVITYQQDEDLVANEPDAALADETPDVVQEAA